MHNITFECSYCHHKRTFTVPIDDHLPADVHLYTDEDGYRYAFCSRECYELFLGIRKPKPERHDATTMDDRFIRYIS